MRRKSHGAWAGSECVLSTSRYAGVTFVCGNTWRSGGRVGGTGPVTGVPEFKSFTAAAPAREGNKLTHRTNSSCRNRWSYHCRGEGRVR